MNEDMIKKYVNEILDENNGDYRITLIKFMIDTAEKKGDEFISIAILKEIINDEDTSK